MKRLLPREHGSWDILLVPFLTAAIAGVWNARLGVAFVVILLAFLARTPLEVLYGSSSEVRRRPHLSREEARRWAGIYLGAALGTGLLLVIYWDLGELAGLGGLAVLFFLLHWREVGRGRARSWRAELLGVGALTLSAPVAWIASTGRLSMTGWLVWVLNAAFFAGGVAYVKARVQAVAAAGAQNSPAPGRLVWAFHLALALGAASLALGGWVSPLVILPFVVALALRAAWGGRRLGQRFAIRELGWQEVAHSLVFAVLLVMAFRW